MQAPAGQELPSLLAGKGSFTPAVGFMLMGTLGSQPAGATGELPTSLQAVLRPVKFMTVALGPVAETMLTACGFSSAAVSA